MHTLFRNNRVLFVFITALCSILILLDPLLTDTTLPFIDSYVHAQKVEQGLTSGFSATYPYYFGPVFHLLIASISLICNLSVLDSLRFFAIIMRVLLVLLVYTLSKNFLDKKSALISVICASAIVEYIWPIPQALATIFLGAVVLFIHKFEKTNHSRYVILGYIITCMLCFLHLVVTIACFGLFFCYSAVKISSDKKYIYLLPI